MNRSVTSTLIRVGDIFALYWLCMWAAVTVHYRRYPMVETSTYASAPTVGRVLFQLATAEERYFDEHGRYARGSEDLEIPTLPDRWRARVMLGTKHRYRFRLDVPTLWPSAVVCRVSGRRRQPETIEPFEVDCRPVHQPAAR